MVEGGSARGGARRGKRGAESRGEGGGNGGGTGGGGGAAGRGGGGRAARGGEGGGADRGDGRARGSRFAPGWWGGRRRWGDPGADPEGMRTGAHQYGAGGAAPPDPGATASRARAGRRGPR